MTATGTRSEQTASEAADSRRFRKSALLCIDLQYLDAARGQGIFAGERAGAQQFYFTRLEQIVLPNVARLQQAFREAGEEVIHCRIQSLTQDGRDRSLGHKRLGLLAPPDSLEARFLEQVAPQGDEIVINKTTSGIFESTNLRYVLSNLRIEELFVTGVYTDECVSSTVRVASDIGFRVSVIDDACSAVTPELHRSAIATLRNRYARIVDTEQAIEEMKSHGPRQTAADQQLAFQDAAFGDPAPGRSVVLLGGDAFADQKGNVTMEGQFRYAERALARMLPLLDEQHELVIGHGNGPQVGHMLARAEAGRDDAYDLPLEVCVAESEGELGYVLQQSLHNVLRDEGIKRPVVSVLTQTVVDKHDPAFDDPQKPVGPSYDEGRARELKEQGLRLRRYDQGFRRVVASPTPVEVLEVGVMQGLLQMGVVVVAAGGGGIPVVKDDRGRLRGVDAVVDKDLAGALMAEALRADRLIILTSVPCVYRDYGTPDQRPLGRIACQDLQRLLDEDHFEAGTMAPKVRAALRFATTGGHAIICDADSLAEALQGRAGTIVEPS